MNQIFWTVLQSAMLLGLLTSSLSATTLKEIQKRGTLRIGVKNNMPLLGFTNAEGKLDGFEIELAQTISRIIWGDRIQVEYVPLLNQERLSAVANGQVDLAIANLRVTESRRRVVFFSQPYLTSQTSFVTRSEIPATFANIQTGKIGVLQGSTAISRLHTQFPEATLIGIKSYQEAQQKLASADIDSFAADRVILRGWQYGAPSTQPSHSRDQPSFNPSQFQFSQRGIGLSHIAIAMPKGLQHQNLHDAVNLALDTLERSSELQQMRNKWRLSLEDRTALDRLDQTSERLGAIPIHLDLAPNVN